MHDGVGKGGAIRPQPCGTVPDWHLPSHMTLACLGDSASSPASAFVIPVAQWRVLLLWRKRLARHVPLQELRRTWPSHAGQTPPPSLGTFPELGGEVPFQRPHSARLGQRAAPALPPLARHLSRHPRTPSGSPIPLLLGGQREMIKVSTKQDRPLRTSPGEPVGCGGERVWPASGRASANSCLGHKREERRTRPALGWK